MKLLLIALTVVNALWVGSVQCESMSGRQVMTAEMALQWQWPAGRKPQQKIAVRVSSVTPESKGFLGIRQSPSFGDAFQDGMMVRGEVVANGDRAGTAVTLRAPKAELKGLKDGDLAAIGVLGNSVAICFTIISKDLAPSALNGWLEEWDCR